MGSNPRATLDRPSFFMPLVNDKYETKLMLPHSFVQKHRTLIPQNATLRIRTGKTWDVKVEENEEGFFFTEGWKEFITDLGLQPRQTLVFWFDVGKAMFDVYIFKRNYNELVFGTRYCFEFDVGKNIISFWCRLAAEKSHPHHQI